MTAFANSALNSSVLLLNRQYVAIHVVDVRRAFILLMRRLAEVIHIEDGQWGNHDFESWREVSDLQAQYKEPHQDWIQAVNFEIQVPRVLRLLHYDRVPKQRVRLNRRNIFARDSNHCQYCGKRFATSELSLDHVRADVPGRRDFVGKLGVRMRALQRPQGRANAARSGHQAD